MSQLRGGPESRSQQYGNPRGNRLPPVRAVDSRGSTARSKSAESTRRRSGNPAQPSDDVQAAVNRLGEQFHILTTEVYRLVKQKNQESIQTLAQQLHAKSRVVDTLVEDHRRINQDLQTIHGSLAQGEQEHRNVASNLTAIVDYVNQQLPAVAAASGAGSQPTQTDVNAVAAAKSMLQQLAQEQQQQAQTTASIAQREARKSAILFSSVVQMGQLLDGLRADVMNKVSDLAGTMNRRLGLTEDAAPDEFRAASAREVAALEQRLLGNIHAATQQASEAVAQQRQLALDDVQQSYQASRRDLSKIGVDTQALKIQLQLETKQRQALENEHRQWLQMLRDGLVASGEEAGSRIAGVLARLDETAATQRAESQRTLDIQRQQLLNELEKRAVALKEVEEKMFSSLREAEERLVQKIAARQTAAETNAHRLVQRCDTLEGEVRTITDAVTRSMGSLKETQGQKLGQIEKVIKAEITTRTTQQEETKARLEGVIGSITRAIDAVQENTADDMQELEEKLVQTAAALNMSTQQGRQQLQAAVDEDVEGIRLRLDHIEGVMHEIDPANAAQEHKIIEETMERMIVNVELQAAHEGISVLTTTVADLQEELLAERKMRRLLEEKVNQLLDGQRKTQEQDAMDWRESVNAATAWLENAAGGSAKVEPTTGSDPGQPQPKPQMRLDVFEE